MKKTQHYSLPLKWLKFYIYILLPFMIFFRFNHFLGYLVGRSEWDLYDFLSSLVIFSVFFICFCLIIFLDKLSYYANIFLNLFFLLSQVLANFNNLFPNPNSDIIVSFINILDSFLNVVLFCFVLLVSLNLYYFYKRKSLFFTSLNELVETNPY